MQPGSVDEAEIEAWLSPEGDGARLVVEERGLPLDELFSHGAPITTTRTQRRETPPASVGSAMMGPS
jgi:hypothetical protein